MSRKERRELINRLTVLFLSLLKWNFQPAKQSKSWQDVIKEQKNQVKALIEESPSLKPFFDESSIKAYSSAKMKASQETGLLQESFPESCPSEFFEVATNEGSGDRQLDHLIKEAGRDALKKTMKDHRQKIKDAVSENFQPR